MNETRSDQKRDPDDPDVGTPRWIIYPEPTPEEFAALAAVLVLIEQRMVNAAPIAKNGAPGKTAWQRAARREALAGGNTTGARSPGSASDRRQA